MIERSNEISVLDYLRKHIPTLLSSEGLPSIFCARGCQAYMSSSVLRFAFANEEITKFLSVGCIKLNVDPLEGERLVAILFREVG